MMVDGAGGGPATLTAVGVALSAPRAPVASAEVVGYRSPGALASARATTPSIAAGTPGPTADGRGGGSLWCRCAYPNACGAAKGACPVSASCRTQPSE